MAGDKSLPWKQAEAAREGQRRGQGSRPRLKPKRPPQVFGGGHPEWLAKLRGVSETVEELLDKLEESEWRGDYETFEELLTKLEESEERELLVWRSMHSIQERFSCLMPRVSS